MPDNQTVFNGNPLRAPATDVCLRRVEAKWCGAFVECCRKCCQPTFGRDRLGPIVLKHWGVLFRTETQHQGDRSNSNDKSLFRGGVVGLTLIFANGDRYQHVQLLKRWNRTGCEVEK
ncbi:hypothetical protein TNCT_103421 [Trichonephila clavata]|uniref:Uncharacterized protein n=1 Tax=Trichonephila clavata TaxID=2740835 RepID=A0A8X6GZJ1_TRICU|nr:hypothetical protein TNCT_103421 [Trichonephila clavata]